jgi:hypothetical protein
MHKAGPGPFLHPIYFAILHPENRLMKIILLKPLKTMKKILFLLTGIILAGTILITSCSKDSSEPAGNPTITLQTAPATPART